MDKQNEENKQTATASSIKSSGLLCGWMPEDEDSDSFQTDCGEMFILNEGTPTDNGMKFCCYCGKQIDDQKVES